MMACSPSDYTTPLRKYEGVGGPCAYRVYSGIAEISDIKEQRRNEKGTGIFDVRFRFIPDEPVQENFANPEGKIFYVQTPGFTMPDRKFLAEHGIVPGAHIPCEMKVIQSGTCSPIVFRFPVSTKEDHGKPLAALRDFQCQPIHMASKLLQKKEDYV